jgi:hypothetical protein
MPPPSVVKLSSFALVNLTEMLSMLPPPSLTGSPPRP